MISSKLEQIALEQSKYAFELIDILLKVPSKHIRTKTILKFRIMDLLQSSSILRQSADEIKKLGENND
jgi:hypothetical protein